MLRLPRCKCAIVCFSHCLLAVILVASLALALSPLTYSQETTAAVQGYVKDSTGAVIAGAAVEIAGPALGSKKTETDSTGFYRFSSLPPGVYTLTVNAKGFRAVKRQDVSLDVGRLPNIGFPVGDRLRERNDRSSRRVAYRGRDTEQGGSHGNARGSVEHPDRTLVSIRDTVCSRRPARAFTERQGQSHQWLPDRWRQRRRKRLLD